MADITNTERYDEYQTICAEEDVKTLDKLTCSAHKLLIENYKTTLKLIDMGHNSNQYCRIDISKIK